MTMTVSAIKDNVYEVLCRREHADVITQLRPTSIFTISTGELTDVYLECSNAREFLGYVKHAVLKNLKEKLKILFKIVN